MTLRALLTIVFRTQFAPRAGWSELAARVARDPAGWGVLLAALAVLAAMPALGWSIGLATGLPNPWVGADLARAEPLRAAIGALATFGAGVASVGCFAAGLWAIAPLYRSPRDIRGAVLVAICAAATPLAFGLLLVLPALVTMMFVACLQALAVAYFGVQAQLRVRSDEAAEYLAIAVTVATLLSLGVGAVSASWF